MTIPHAPQYSCTFSHKDYTNLVMNIEWDYSYYQPWSDNKWFVDKMLALMSEDVTIQ